MIAIAIVDDEAEVGRRVESIVKKEFEKTESPFKVKYYQHPRELLWDLQEKKYFDIFFLDIEMNVNGLEVARQIREMYLEPYIVFVTSYVKYSVRGYEYGAYRYILKDEIDEKLPEAIDYMCKKMESMVQKQYIIEAPSKIKKIDFRDIYYMYVEGKYTYFCTRNGNVRVRKPLGEVYKELDTPAFVYADKGHIVNLQHVMSMEERTIQMRNGDQVVVSFPQTKKVREAICQYWRKQQ